MPELEVRLLGSSVSFFIIIIVYLNKELSQYQQDWHSNTGELLPS